MQILDPEMEGVFVYVFAWPKSGGRVPSAPHVDSHDILAAVQGELVEFRALIHIKFPHERQNHLPLI